MPAFSVPLSELAATLKMDTIYAPKELSDIPIYTADVNRPGIMLDADSFVCLQKSPRH